MFASFPPQRKILLAPRAPSVAEGMCRQSPFHSPRATNKANLPEGRLEVTPSLRCPRAEHLAMVGEHQVRVGARAYPTIEEPFPLISLRPIRKRGGDFLRAP